MSWSYLLTGQSPSFFRDNFWGILKKGVMQLSPFTNWFCVCTPTSPQDSGGDWDSEKSCSIFFSLLFCRKTLPTLLVSHLAIPSSCICALLCKFQEIFMRKKIWQQHTYSEFPLSTRNSQIHLRLFLMLNVHIGRFYICVKNVHRLLRLEIFNLLSMAYWIQTPTQPSTAQRAFPCHRLYSCVVLVFRTYSVYKKEIFIRA